MRRMLSNITATMTESSDYDDLIDSDDLSEDLDLDDISEDIELDPPVDEDEDDTPSDYLVTVSELVTQFTAENMVDTNKYSLPVEYKPYPYCPVFIQRVSDTNFIATVYITGVIIDVYEYILLLEVLETMREGDKMYIFIDSPGGAVSTGATVASSIDSCKGHVTGIARGFCASAASLIWSSCHTCIASPLSTFLYHMSSHFDYGNSEAIRKKATIMTEYVRRCLLKVAEDKGHITEEEIDRICRGKEDVIIPATVMQTRISPTKTEGEAA